MHHTNTHHRGLVATTALVLLLLACLGLAACGGSSSSSTTTSTTNAANTSSTTGAAGTGGPASGRFASLRACLQKAGITLPQRTPGQRPRPGVGGFLGGAGGGPQLPKGVTRAQLAAALQKCDGGRAFGGGARFNNPAYSQALTAFAACMRQNGVSLPSPNSSGTGPVFSTKGINTTSAQFRAAETKCQNVLRSALPHRAGAGGGGSTGGA
jgi:hypothetical protein